MENFPIDGLNDANGDFLLVRAALPRARLDAISDRRQQ